jgi:hypothetical protein
MAVAVVGMESYNVCGDALECGIPIFAYVFDVAMGDYLGTVHRFAVLFGV